MVKTINTKLTSTEASNIETQAEGLVVAIRLKSLKVKFVAIPILYTYA